MSESDGSTPAVKFTRPVQVALEEAFPLFWVSWRGEFRLLAETYSWENGKNRTRVIFRSRDYAASLGLQLALEAQHPGQAPSRRGFDEVRWQVWEVRGK